MIDENGVERQSCLVHLKDDVEYISTDGVFMKAMIMERPNTLVAQHSHKYSHTSLVSSGSVRLWCDGKLVGDFKAPHFIEIPSGTKHKFMSLEANTVVYCIHNVATIGETRPVILEENSLKEAV